MTLAKAVRRPHWAESGAATISRRVFAVDPRQKQRRVVAHTIRDCISRYVRWAEGHGYKVERLEEIGGEEAGIKSATVRINARGPSYHPKVNQLSAEASLSE